MTTFEEFQKYILMIIISAIGRTRTETALSPKTALFPALVLYSTVVYQFTSLPHKANVYGHFPLGRGEEYTPNSEVIFGFLLEFDRRSQVDIY